jgi:hypothetical protein
LACGGWVIVWLAGLGVGGWLAAWALGGCVCVAI